MGNASVGKLNSSRENPYSSHAAQKTQAGSVSTWSSATYCNVFVSISCYFPHILEHNKSYLSKMRFPLWVPCALYKRIKPSTRLRLHLLFITHIVTLLYYQTQSDSCLFVDPAVLLASILTNNNNIKLNTIRLTSCRWLKNIIDKHDLIATKTKVFVHFEAKLLTQL